MENQDNSGHNIFCAKCGVALDPTVRFCPACGQEVQPVPTRPVLPVPQPLPPPPVIQVPSGVGSSERGVVCPRCGSDQVHAEKRGWRWTTGFIGSGKILITCLRCGNRFEPGSGACPPCYVFGSEILHKASCDEED